MSLVLFVLSIVHSSFSTSPLLPFYYSSFHLSVLMRTVQWMRLLTFCIVSSFPIAFLIIFRGLAAFLIGRTGSFTLLAVMGCSGIALLSQFIYFNSQATMDHAFDSGVRGTFFRAIPQSIHTSIHYVITSILSYMLQNVDT